MSTNAVYWISVMLAMVLNIGVMLALIMMNQAKFYEVPELPEEVIIGSPEHFDLFTSNVEQLSIELKEKKDKLTEREQALRELEMRVKAEQADLLRMKDEIKDFREDFSDSLLVIEESEEKNLKELAETFSNLSPDAAVSIFEEMEDEFVVKILMFMANDVVAQIFQTMAARQGPTGPMAQRVAKFTEMMRLKSESPKN